MNVLFQAVHNPTASASGRAWRALDFLVSAWGLELYSVGDHYQIIAGRIGDDAFEDAMGTAHDNLEKFGAGAVTLTFWKTGEPAKFYFLGAGEDISQIDAIHVESVDDEPAVEEPVLEQPL